jgi:hypothetical protein
MCQWRKSVKLVYSKIGFCLFSWDCSQAAQLHCEYRENLNCVSPKATIGKLKFDILHLWIEM